MAEEYYEEEYDTHRHWDNEVSFNDVLAEQLKKAPYLIGSILVHGIIGILISSWILLTSTTSEVPEIQMAQAPPPPEVEEEEPPPPEEIEEVIEEPVLQDTELDEVVEQETLEETGDPDFDSDAPFDQDAWNNDVGLGGGGGGKYGKRGGRGGKRGGTATEKAVSAALKWLADHQDADGFWDADDFMYQDKFDDKPPSDGKGNSINDVGLTGLSLLAFQGNGNTMATGKYKENVGRGIAWLKNEQDDEGLIGEEHGESTLYNHSVATMALGEAYYFSNQSPTLRKPMKNAVKVIVNARNAYMGWRYNLEPTGANDSSITGWMVFALKTAQDSKIKVGKDVFLGAEEVFNSLTDTNTGRTGYTFEANGGGVGSYPSRRTHLMDKFPGHKSEALTAVALLCCIFMTDTQKVKKWKDHPQYEILQKQADLLKAKLPVWDEQAGTIDLYYWYYATFALNQWGEDHWKQWKKAIEKALVPNQRLKDEKDNFYGSWDPQNAAWGEDGGRVYSTAICALILEVYYRYANVFGSR